MRVNFTGAGGSYCGTIRSFEHCKNSGDTTVIFTGSIKKVYRDEAMFIVVALSKGFIENVRYLTVNTKQGGLKL